MQFAAVSKKYTYIYTHIAYMCSDFKKLKRLSETHEKGVTIVNFQ